METKKEYSRITENDVVNVIIKTAHNWDGVGIISPSNIAHLLNTSRYQVDKYIKSLKNEGLLKYTSVNIGCEEELFPPYNGYKLSEKGTSVYAKELKESEEKEIRLIEECFGKI